jgi:OOP family OmpA-OmpF porin
MKYFFSRFFIVVCLFAAYVTIAEGKAGYVFDKSQPIGQSASQIPDSTDNTPKKGKKAKKDKDNKDNKDGKGQRDSQNQTKFMKPDMEAQEYNFYDRKKISTPLMPRYDLDSAVYQKGTFKKEEQQKAFMQNKYRYPARPKDQWEIGLQGGSSLIAGDITPDWTKGWGGGFTVRKAINYYFSLRLEYTYSQIKALDLKPRQDVEFDAALNGSGTNANYFGGNIGNEKIIFHNYLNMVHAAHIEGVLNLGNILFHKERTKVDVGLFFGVGAHMWRTKEDMLDKNGNDYDFAPAIAIYNSEVASHSSASQTNRAVRNELEQILQGNYSVDAARPTKGSYYLAHYNITPDFTGGLEMDFHVSKWVTLGISERFTFNNNSQIDGVQWQDDSHPAFAQHYDHYFQTMAHINFNIGKNAVEPLWWLNPLDFTYKKLSDVNPDKIAADLFKDTDEDGVPDRLDKEPNTKKGCPVDVHGVILDSDKDGIPDCDDKEPFSPPGYPIDQNGVAIIPPNPCCDNAEGGDTLFDANGKPVIGPDGKVVMNGAGKNGKGGRNRGQYDCSKMEMPGVYFDEDKYYIDPAYQSALHQVAEKLQMCPDVKMVITGVDESKNDQKYNEQLAYNRASSVVDYLVEKYGISRDRFIVKYQGGKRSDAAKTPSERKRARRVDFNYAGDGEKGESNPPAPHPGLKAGSNK